MYGQFVLGFVENVGLIWFHILW